jgi:magnesium chelatase subunit I
MAEQEFNKRPSPDEQPSMRVNSLRELIDLVSGKSIDKNLPEEESGIAESLPFPFLGIVGQPEMKLALLLSLVNPLIGGVLLIGPRGTGKTTAVRSLMGLLPEIERSACFYGCLPEDIESGGLSAVCPDCARKYGQGEPLTLSSAVRLVELPLNARLEDVIGGLDERAQLHERMRLRRGILAHSDRNILYVDEVNLLDDAIVNAILDAAAQGTYTVRRGPLSATYNARFILIGSMNPEEGDLRSQIMDRFGLRVIVRGLAEPAERKEAYDRSHLFRAHPRQVIAQYASEMDLTRHEIQAARKLLPHVELPSEIAAMGIRLIQELQIDSLRAEIALFESARAYAAADGRTRVELKDIEATAPLALRMRRSAYLEGYFKERAQEDETLKTTINQVTQKHDRRSET